MENESILAEVVMAWVGAELPGEAGVADRAAHVAADAYLGGASVAEACRTASAFVGSWTRHPSHWKPGQAAEVALAS